MLRRLGLAVLLVGGLLGILLGTEPRAVAADCVAQGRMTLGSPLTAFGATSTSYSMSIDVSASLCLDAADFASAGTLSGSCTSFSGSGSGVTFSTAGRLIVFTGAITAWGYWMPNTATGDDCEGIFGPGADDLLLTLFMTDDDPISDVTVPSIPPTSELPPVTVPTTSSTTSTTAPAGTMYSNTCDSVIHDATVAGVTTKVYSKGAAVGVTWLCVRAGSGSTGVGGRLEITQPSPGGLPGLPTTDDQPQLCETTPGNTAPGPHPFAKGTTLGVEYFLDVWQGPAETWLCVQAATTKLRVKVATGGGGPTLPNVVWRPDPGTPG